MGVLFDVLNIFTMQPEDAYRRVYWKHPLSGDKLALQNVNALFKMHQSNMLGSGCSLKRGTDSAKSGNSGMYLFE